MKRDNIKRTWRRWCIIGAILVGVAVGGCWYANVQALRILKPHFHGLLATNDADTVIRLLRHYPELGREEYVVWQWYMSYNPDLLKSRSREFHVTPLHTASGDNRLCIVKALLAATVQADIDAQDSNGWTPLHRAAYEGHVDIAEALIEAKANVHALDWERETPLHQAARQDEVPMAELLLESGAKVNFKDLDGETPLHFAACSGSVGVAKLLIKAGVDVNAKDAANVTPLLEAADQGHLGVVKLLLKAGADVNIEDGDAGTPLCGATRSGNINVVELLLKMGASVNVMNANDQTALDWVCVAPKKEREPIRALLRKYGAKTGAELKAEAEAKAKRP